MKKWKKLDHNVWHSHAFTLHATRYIHIYLPPLGEQIPKERSLLGLESGLKGESSKVDLPKLIS